MKKLDDKHYPLRLPQELYNKIKALAIDEKRSINSQIIVLLEEGIKNR